MSWETMTPESRPCGCGKGTITYVMEMDDWNRTRHHRQVNCPACKAKEAKEAAESRERRKQREELLAKAKSIAEERYLAQWVAMFASLNKRQAWELYTKGSGYPALGTFYRHMKEQGVSEYMRSHFSDDFRGALATMGVEDSDINRLLSETDRI